MKYGWERGGGGAGGKTELGGGLGLLEYRYMLFLLFPPPPLFPILVSFLFWVSLVIFAISRFPFLSTHRLHGFPGLEVIYPTEPYKSSRARVKRCLSEAAPTGILQVHDAT